MLSLISLIPVATAGFENCIYCHGNPAQGIPYINLTSINNSIHGRINNTNNLNYACYACHWNGTSPKNHTNNRNQVKTCENCHKGDLFNAPSVAEHIPGSQNISTDIDCISCHNNSIDANAIYNKTSDRVAHFGTTTDLMSPSIRSTNCTWCHFDNSRNTAWGTPEDPRVSGTAFNHTRFNSSIQCYGCHISSGIIPSTFHSNSLGKWMGNRDCVSCHDTGGIAPKHIDVSATGDSRSVHSALNSDAVTSLNPNNLRCWACHGDGNGSEAVQPAGGHPLNYRTPKNCNNNECHSISQSKYEETMIYSHFQNASKNGNPDNATNYNITTSVQCQACHVNSLVKKDDSSGLALVSHYGSKDNLVDSFNCIYCHLDKDNSKNWGNATLINKNRTGLIMLEKEKNKFTAFEGESVYLGGGYFLKLVEISTRRWEAFIQLLQNDSIIDEVSLGVNTPYRYEKEITIDSSTLKMPVITLNITSIFKSNNNSFIQFEGYRARRIHTDRENNNSACYACHLYRYSREKERYVVTDREYRENSNDIIYYTRVLIDFIPENKNKIYFNEEDYIFDQLENYSGRFFSFPYRQKYLKEGKAWNIADGYSLKLNEISTDSKQAWLTLTINNITLEDGTVEAGSEFKHTEGDDIVFTGKVAAISQGKPNFIILQDVLALSPQVMEITANAALFGYNTSWFKPADTFTVGNIPVNLHSPNLYDNHRDWADCMECHDASKKLRISAIPSNLGKHSRLNNNASNKTSLSDSIDKACWACHTDGAEPQMHSSTYIIPRNCTSCHTYQKKPSFGAIYIGDEPHGNLTNCELCHIRGSHTLVRFGVTPVIKEAVLFKNRVNSGETVKLTAKAIAGYRMRIRAIEYFLDKKGDSGKGIPFKPPDGIFDSQSEEVSAQINTTGLTTGAHRIYIHAMERDNKWGEFYPVNLTITSSRSDASKNNTIYYAGSVIISLITALAHTIIGLRNWI